MLEVTRLSYGSIDFEASIDYGLRGDRKFTECKKEGV